jgi:hypothetical protein
LFSGGGTTLPIANSAERYLFQLPGSQGTPVVRSTGQAHYSDRISEYVFIKELKLEFEYASPVNIRVFAFRKNNQGTTADFVFRQAGGDYHFFHYVRSGATAGVGVGALDGVLSATGESPLRIARTDTGQPFFACATGDPIDTGRSGNDLYNHVWSDMTVVPTQWAGSGGFCKKARFKHKFLFKSGFGVLKMADKLRRIILLGW